MSSLLIPRSAEKEPSKGPVSQFEGMSRVLGGCTLRTEELRSRLMDLGVSFGSVELITLSVVVSVPLLLLRLCMPESEEFVN